MYDEGRRMVSTLAARSFFGSKAAMNLESLAALVIVFIIGAIVGWRLWSFERRKRSPE